MKRIYKVLPICLLVLGLVCPGCKPSSTAQLEENKALARRAIEELWNKRNMAVADELFAANFLHHDPVMSHDTYNLESYKQTISMMPIAFPDSHVTIEDQIAEGDKVVTRWTWTGTHQELGGGFIGEFTDVAPTGKQVTIEGVSINRVRDGKIVEQWWFRQIGDTAARL